MTELRTIEGIGRATEKTLQSAGVGSVEELAELDGGELKVLAEVAGIPPGRLEGLAGRAREAVAAPVDEETPDKEEGEPAEDAPAAAGQDEGADATGDDDESPVLPDDGGDGEESEPPAPGGDEEAAVPTIAATIDEVVATRPRYKKLTFLGMKGRPDVGQLDIRGHVFDKGVPQYVPDGVANAILAREQYEFECEEDEEV